MRLLAWPVLAVLVVQPPPKFNDMFGAWSPDGARIVFTSDRTGDPEIFVARSDGTDVRQLTRTPGRDAHPAFSPDGRLIAFQSPRNEGQTRIFLMNADGSNQRQLTANTGFCGVPVFSPDGRRLAFQCAASMTKFGTPEAPWRLYLLDLPGGQPVVRSTGPGNDQVPTWSPDGRRMLFFSDRSGSSQLHSMDLDSGAVTQLTGGPGTAAAGSFSPDGRTIVFMATDGDAAPDVYLMNADGTGRRRITTTGPQHGLPVFSPDGKRILFQQPGETGVRLWTMNADGSNPAALRTAR